MGSCVFLLALAAAAASVAVAVQTTTSTLETMMAPVELDKDTFDVAIMGSKMPWIVAFVRSSTSEEAEKIAEGLEALGRVGIVNVKKSKQLLKHMNIAAGSEPAWRMYPYGNNKTVDGIDFQTGEEAKTAMLDTLPKDLVHVAKYPSEIQEILIQALNSNRLPVLLFSEGKAVPSLLVKLGLWFIDSYYMAYVPDPSEELRKQFNIERLPLLQIMIATPAEDNRMKLSGVPFDRTKFGGLKFRNAAQFMAQAEMELRKNNMWPKPVQPQESDVPAPNVNVPTPEIFEITADTPNACESTKLGLCVVALLDGSPDNKETLEAQLEVLEQVQHLPSNKGRVLHFMWVDVRCHAAFGKVFDVLPDNAPALIAVSPKKSRFAQMIGVFDAERISGFIGGVLGGKNTLSPLKEFPTVSAADDCAALYASTPAAPPADEFDLSNIMGEDVGGSTRAAVEAEAEAARLASDLAAEEAERAEKARIAQAEVDRLNKKTSKKKSAKKSVKTEL